MRFAQAFIFGLALGGAVYSSTISAAPADSSSGKTEKKVADLGQKILEEASQYLDMPYQWGGRGTSDNPNMDCLGIIFRSYSAVFNFDWHKIPVRSNKRMVKSGYLGKPVRGLSAVLREELNADLLKPGDALLFLDRFSNTDDAPLMVKDGIEYRVWHTGLYAGEQQVLHAKPGVKVMIEPLDVIYFDALYVTRRTK